MGSQRVCQVPVHARRVKGGGDVRAATNSGEPTLDERGLEHVDHLLASFALDVELVTVPAKVLDKWAAGNFPMPDRDFTYKAVNASGEPLKPIPYKELDLNLPWQSFDIAHELTTKGIQKFVADYRSTLKRSA